MSELEIIVEDDLFITSNTSIIDTKIWITYNNRSFPFINWTDFTFPILEEWKYNIIKIKDIKNISTTLFFHDGPFWLEVFKDDNMKLKIDCINDRNKKFTEMTIHCDYYDFLNSIYSAIKTFTKILYKNGMNVGDFSSIYKQSIISQKEIRAILSANNVR